MKAIQFVSRSICIFNKSSGVAWVPLSVMVTVPASECVLEERLGVIETSGEGRRRMILCND